MKGTMKGAMKGAYLGGTGTMIHGWRMQRRGEVKVREREVVVEIDSERGMRVAGQG
jgi:hypothetical protein